MKKDTADRRNSKVNHLQCTPHLQRGGRYRRRSCVLTRYIKYGNPVEGKSKGNKTRQSYNDRTSISALSGRQERRKMHVTFTPVEYSPATQTFALTEDMLNVRDLKAKIRSEKVSFYT